MKMKLSTAGLEELEKVLRSLSGEDVQVAVKRAIEAGAPLMVEGLRASLAAHGHNKHGGLSGAIQVRKTVRYLDGGYADIGIKAVPVRGWNYQDIGAELNYGSSRRIGDAWFDNGAAETAPAVEAAMVEAADAFIREKTQEE